MTRVGEVAPGRISIFVRACFRRMDGYAFSKAAIIEDKNVNAQAVQGQQLRHRV